MCDAFTICGCIKVKAAIIGSGAVIISGQCGNVGYGTYLVKNASELYFMKDIEKIEKIWKKFEKQVDKINTHVNFIATKDIVPDGCGFGSLH